MKLNLKIAATTILYNPNMEVIDNIHSYLNDVDVIYAIDNSEKENPDFVKRLIEIGKVRH